MHASTESCAIPCTVPSHEGVSFWDLEEGVIGKQAKCGMFNQAGRGGACGYGPFPIQVGTSLPTPASGLIR
jgi:hypothetical protein